MLTYSVSAIIGKPQGTTERFDFDEAVKWDGEGEPILSKHVTGSVQFLMLPHEINVQISDLRTCAQETCSRCLKAIECSIHIDFAEREFLIDLPEDDLEEGEEIKRVKVSTNEIDLNDMVREEILLHYPVIPVCSQSCKGLCSKCGVDLNEKTCGCVREEAPEVSPFKILRS